MEREALLEQARKISDLLSTSERLGARLVKMEEESAAAVKVVESQLADSEQLVLQGLQVQQQLRAELAEALLWKEMCRARLGPTRELADHQLDVLYSYLKAMGAPGHRIVSFISKRIGKSWIGRGLRRLLYMGIALKKA